MTVCTMKKENRPVVGGNNVALRLRFIEKIIALPRDNYPIHTALIHTLSQADEYVLQIMPTTKFRPSRKIMRVIILVTFHRILEMFCLHSRDRNSSIASQNFLSSSNCNR